MTAVDQSLLHIPKQHCYNLLHASIFATCACLVLSLNACLKFAGPLANQWYQEYRSSYPLVLATKEEAVSSRAPLQTASQVHCSLTGMLKKGTYKWKQDKTKTYHFQLDNCPLSNFTAEDARSCLENKTIVFVGDSVSRYQYLNLVYMLEYGRYPSQAPCSEHGNSIENTDKTFYKCNSFSNLNTWPNSSAFLLGTNMKLPTECCDCYKPQSLAPEMPPEWDDRKIEHRVYTKGNLRVVFLWFAKSYLPTSDSWSGIKGHWMCPPWNQTYSCKAGECHDAPNYEMDLDEALIKVVRPLKPSAVLINAGFHRSTNDWPDYFWHKVSISAMGAVEPSGGRVFWRTTTASKTTRINRWSDYKALTIPPLYGVEILDAFAVTEQLKRVMPEAYWDGWHTTDIVYAELNNYLLNELCPVERQRLADQTSSL